MSSKIKRRWTRGSPKTGDRVVFCKHPDVAQRTDFRVPGNSTSPSDRVKWLSACVICVERYKVPTAIPRGEVGFVEVDG